MAISNPSSPLSSSTPGSAVVTFSGSSLTKMPPSNSILFVSSDSAAMAWSVAMMVAATVSSVIVADSLHSSLMYSSIIFPPVSCCSISSTCSSSSSFRSSSNIAALIRLSSSFSLVTGSRLTSCEMASISCGDNTSSSDKISSSCVISCSSVIFSSYIDIWWVASISDNALPLFSEIMLSSTIFSFSFFSSFFFFCIALLLFFQNSFILSF
mmetsp:Transcript_24204/g.27583  ORF Transcript_24204/g.27583 Transcript_24204/m.27583 type:complete len:211 (-) Transcript_24204:1745-2377(-)